MKHLSDNWDKVGVLLERNVLHDTLRSFSVTNDELANQGQGAGDACTKVCKVNSCVCFRTFDLFSKYAIKMCYTHSLQNSICIDTIVVIVEPMFFVLCKRCSTHVKG